jgi:hypothetical protein
MYQENVNRITFNVERYRSEDEMFQDVAKTLQILTKNDEICTFEYEDVGIYILHHNYANQDFGDLYPYWMTPDDYEDYIYSKNREEDEEEHNEEPEDEK